MADKWNMVLSQFVDYKMKNIGMFNRSHDGTKEWYKKNQWGDMRNPRFVLLGEVKDLVLGRGNHLRQYFTPEEVEAERQKIRDAHGYIVWSALQNGIQVPKKVLNEYPDLDAMKQRLGWTEPVKTRKRGKRSREKHNLARQEIEDLCQDKFSREDKFDHWY